MIGWNQRLMHTIACPQQTQAISARPTNVFWVVRSSYYEAGSSIGRWFHQRTNRKRRLAPTDKSAKVQCLPAVFVFDHNCHDLPLRLGCGADRFLGAYLQGRCVLTAQ